MESQIAFLGAGNMARAIILEAIGTEPVFGAALAREVEEED